MHEFSKELARHLSWDPALAVFCMGLGVILDLFTLYLCINRNVRGRGASGIPVISLFLYWWMAVFSSVPVPFRGGQGLSATILYRLLNIVVMTAFHLLCQFVLPQLHRQWLARRRENG